jgi:metal-responsive CopG/Arc/MetJ family transcriptional regulator
MHSDALCGRVLHMDAVRTERITVGLTPDLLARLDAYAAKGHWTRSTAAAVLIEDGLAGERDE